MIQKDVALFKSTFPEEYWQIVSNSIINEVPKGEAIAYQPYDSEAEEIYRFLLEQDDYQDFKWIAEIINSGNLHALPFQPDESEYPNLVIFEFDIPQSDKDFLTNRVLEAQKLLLA